MGETGYSGPICHEAWNSGKNAHAYGSWVHLGGWVHLYEGGEQRGPFLMLSSTFSLHGLPGEPGDFPNFQRTALVFSKVRELFSSPRVSAQSKVVPGPQLLPTFSFKEALPQPEG